jgi:hypothetical protein
MMSWIDSWHRKISTGLHFQQYGNNSTLFDFKGSFWFIYRHCACYWSTARNFWMSGINSGHHLQYRESIWDIIIYPHMKFRWNRTMLNLCGIVAANLKMETGRKILMSGINSGHHYLPTYQILMISDNVEFVRYCGNPMGKLKFRTLMLITSKWIMIET